MRRTLDVAGGSVIVWLAIGLATGFAFGAEWLGALEALAIAVLAITVLSVWAVTRLDVKQLESLLDERRADGR